MDSPPESVVALSCEPPTSPTLPSLDHSPLGHHHDSPSSFQVSLFPHEEGEGEGKEISILPSPTPAVALFPGGQDEHGPSPDNSPPETPLDPLSLREALPGFGALELALSSTHDPSCSDELDLQLFHNGRPSGEGSEGGSGDGSGGQPAPPALRFPCKVCGKRFRFNSILSLHARAHSLERDRASFACQQCGFRAPHRAGLAVHLKIHQNQAPEPQNQRQTEAPSVIPPATSENTLFLVTGATPSVEEPGPLSSTLAEDPALANSTAFRCHACKGKFRTASELTRHVRILHNPYKCALCPFSASQEEDLASHLRESHPPLSPAQEEKAPPSVAMAAVAAPPPPPAFRCETCGQRFTQSWFLKGHMRKHKDSLDHKCQVCGRGFKEPWFLKNHMKVHLNKLGLKVLGASCSDEQTKAVPGGQALGTLYSSLLLARGGAEKTERDALAKLVMVGAGEAGGPSKASLLGYLGLPGDGAGASCMERLAAVAQVAEMGGGSGSGNAAPAGGVGDQAAVWHLVARSLVAAQQAHQQQQQRPRQRQQQRSSVAGEAEQVRAYLGGLASRQDHPDGPWECPDCGKLFRSLQQAVVHARVHAQRPPKGDEGGKQSGSLQPTTGAAGGHSTATSHFQGENGVRGASPGPPSGPRERVRGAGVKDCPYCGKAFRSSHHLKVHLRVHTGERPYKCPHCDYAGTQSGSLKYHLQRHHREQRSSSSSSTPSGAPSRSAALTSSPGASQALLGARQRGSQGPFGRHGQQWQLGSAEQRERKAGLSQRDALADPEGGLRYLPGMAGGFGTAISEGGWAGDAPQAKLPKVSRRKPLTTSRMVPTNGRRGSAGPRGRQEGFEPLDLSRRPSQGDGCDEDGGGVTLNQCLFCPFRTSSAELMAMHLQVNHTSKSRRKRGSRGQAWPHREAPRPAAHAELDTLALWKSWRQEADWAASRAVTPNGLSPPEGRPRSALNFTANPSPDLTTPRNMEHERQEEQDEEEEEEIEGDSSSVGDSPRRQLRHNPFSPVQCEEVFPTEERRSDD